MKKLMQLLAGLAMAIIAVSPVWADVEPVVPDQTYITFMPIPNDVPLTLLKDNTTDVKLYPKDAKDTVYYRILSVDGANQTAPITAEDKKIEILSWGASHGYEPIHVDESMVNTNGQFVVKAAVRKPDGTFSEETTAAYNIEILIPIFASSLKYTAPDRFVVGAQYEMWVNVECPQDTLTKYQNTMSSFIVNWDGSLFANVEYRFHADSAYKAVPAEDLEDKVTVVRNFAKLVSDGIQFRFTIVRKRQTGMDYAEVGMGISVYTGVQVSLEAEYLAGSDFKIPFVDRPAADPIFTPTAGYIEKGKTIQIRSTTANTKIFYTADGSYPTLESTEYTTPVTINGRTTVKALAKLQDGQDSDTSFVSEAEYSVVGIPDIKPAARRVVIDTLVEITLTDGRGNTLEKGTTKIYYTLDGTEPTSASTEYNVPFRLKKDDTQLKVIAMKDGDESPVVTREYNLVPATPIPSRKRGDTLEEGQTVAFTCPTKDAVIYYTIDKTGEVTKTNGTKYSGPIGLKKSSTIRVVAYVGESRSTQEAFAYVVLMAAPVFSLQSGVVPYRARLELSSTSIATTAGSTFPAAIAYTTDGTEPSKANVLNLPKYTTPIEITDDVTITAVTCAQSYSGWVLSKTTSATYTLNRPAAPVFSVESGSVDEGTVVELTCETPNVTMYYTLDGSEPTAESAVYEEPFVISEDVTIKAIAISDNPDDAPSRVAEASYINIPWDGTVAAPTFNRAGGLIEKGAMVSMACETVKASIYYTLDDSEPTALSTPYEMPIEITEDVTVKAIAIRENAVSDVSVVAYIIEKEKDTTANESLELTGVSLYPNPSDGEVHITLPVAATIEVFAANGALYQTVNASAGEFTLNLYRSGIYFLRITGEGRTTVKRVVVR